MSKLDAKYNTGSSISGTTQSGRIALSTGSPDYSQSGWVAGIDDTGCYVIVGDTTQLGLSGRSAGGGTSVIQIDSPTFWKTNDTTDAELLRIVNKLPGVPQQYNDVTSARNWITSSGIYTILPIYDSIRSALSTNQSAYDAASVGNFIKVTSAEYANVFATVSGASKYIMTDADLTSAFSGWSTGYNVSYDDSTKALGVIPINHYIIGYAYSGNFPSVAQTTYLRTGTTVNGTHTKLGSNITFTDNGAKTVYFIRKNPASPNAAKTYVSFYTTGSALGQVSGKTNYPIYYSVNIDTNTWTSFNGGYPTFQVMSTATKSWA